MEMKFYKSVITCFVIIFVNFGLVFAANDADLIPPEVLKQMDPDIRSCKRPIFATIHQGDIFGLRENPEFDADVVKFDFDVSKLSTVQLQIIENWIRSGHNTVYLKDADIGKYSSLLSPIGLYTQFAVGCKSSAPAPVSCTLLRHQVNTDCESVVFHRLYSSVRISTGGGTCGGSHFFWSVPCLTNIPEEGTVIVEAGGGNAVCGVFPLGEGRILFRTTVSGTDSRRWVLNFWHWAMGLGVPGAAETGIPGSGSSGLSLEEAKKYDLIVLKNGDTVTGTVENKNFTLKSSYSEMAFEISEVAKIVFAGAGSNVDVIRLKVGDKISGVVQDEKVVIKLVSGTSIEVEKDKIKEIKIRQEIRK